MSSEARKEFQKIRNQIMRKYGFKELICARCGYSNKSNHLHHIDALIWGCQNIEDNLIPLCSICHQEWDHYENLGIGLGEFLLIPSSLTMAILLANGMGKLNNSVGEIFMNFSHIKFYGNAFAYENKHRGKPVATDYFEQLERQNEVFSSFPYSNTEKMLCLYGKIFEITDSPEEIDNYINLIRKRKVKIRMTPI